LIGDTLILEKQIALGVDERTGKDKIETEYHGYRAEPRDWFLSLRKINERQGIARNGQT
jgi:hypothetical protein